MLTIGLTGGIASGKSTAAAILGSFGITIIDADKIARQLVMPHQAAYLAIVKHFGVAIMNTDTSLNRTALRDIIFNQPLQKTWLEELLHPQIRAQIQCQLKHVTSLYCIIEIPLLRMDKCYDYLDRILVIDCDVATQIKRVQQRDQLDATQIAKIINSQPSRDYRLSIANDIITNNATQAQLRSDLEQLHDYYLSLIH